MEVRELAAKTEQDLNVAPKSADRVEFLIQNLLKKGKNESSDSKQALDLKISFKNKYIFSTLTYSSRIKYKKGLFLMIPYLIC